MTKITGNTYPVKDNLRELGGKWNVTEKCWEVPDDKADAARALVTSAPAPISRARNSGYSSGAAKRCWECGRMFTYADAKRNDGDWNDSYCGC